MKQVDTFTGLHANFCSGPISFVSSSASLINVDALAETRPKLGFGPCQARRDPVSMEIPKLYKPVPLLAS